MATGTQKPASDLNTQSNEIYNEATPQANTKTRIGQIFLDIIASMLLKEVPAASEARIFDESGNTRAFYHGLPSHTVATANALSSAYKQLGVSIWVTDETGGACPAHWDGSNWVRSRDLTTISV